MTKRPVQVRFVGSGDAFGSGGRFQACILLHAPGHNGDVLLDCGASSLIALNSSARIPTGSGWCWCRTCMATTSAACRS